MKLLNNVFRVLAKVQKDEIVRLHLTLMMLPDRCRGIVGLLQHDTNNGQTMEYQPFLH